MGAKGYAGEEGEPGEPALVFTSPKGFEQGDIGAQGFVGRQGPVGDRGESGVDGEDGEPGRMGPKVLVKSGLSLCTVFKKSKDTQNISQSTAQLADG